MRLFEISTPPLYLNSDAHYEVGTTISAKAGARALGAVVEGWLERTRPPHMMKRPGTIALQDRPLSKLAFSYRVRPLAVVDRCHTGWLQLLSKGGDLDEPLIEEWTTNYWMGNECPSIPGMWEYRTQKITVTELVERE